VLFQICFQACVSVIAPAPGLASALSNAPGAAEHRTVAALALAYICHSSSLVLSASSSIFPAAAASSLLPSASLAAAAAAFPALCAALRQADRATVHAALVALRALVIGMSGDGGDGSNGGAPQQHALGELAAHAASLLQCVFLID
jgi:hypothetical protein